MRSFFKQHPLFSSRFFFLLEWCENIQRSREGEFKRAKKNKTKKIFLYFMAEVKRNVEGNIHLAFIQSSALPQTVFHPWENPPFIVVVVVVAKRTKEFFFFHRLIPEKAKTQPVAFVPKTNFPCYIKPFIRRCSRRSLFASYVFTLFLIACKDESISVCFLNSFLPVENEGDC